jgi:hypothetical protein
MNAMEEKRQVLQLNLDSQRSTEYRRRLGQFATPFDLASEIVRYGVSLLGDKPIRFLEPALGTGSFYSALVSSVGNLRIERSIGVEIDEEIGIVAKLLWGDNLNLVIGDFTKTKPLRKSTNLLISNPPYVRHHLISSQNKESLKRTVLNKLGITISGLAGLYCYFILLAHEWLEDEAVSGWLIPSEFMDVRYGNALKEYLLDKVQLLRIHRFDPTAVQFDDALVSSAVVWYKKKATAEDYAVEFSYGGSLGEPKLTKLINRSVLSAEHKWTRFPINGIRDSKATGIRIKDLFSIKRGIATGDNKFFILDRQKIEQYGLRFDYLTPVLPSPRHLKVTEILADYDNNPLLDNQLFLINCNLPEDQIKDTYPELYSYLQTGIDSVADRYLCRSKHHWYQQEQRLPAPILCTYMGRSSQGSGSPFRFILNQSRAVATNTYLMLYPNETYFEESLFGALDIRAVWEKLNALPPNALTCEGRVYGGGLQKIEPKELGEVIIDV